MKSGPFFSRVAPALAFAMLLSACNDVSSPQLSAAPGPRGKTDQIVSGYDNIVAGSEEEFILTAGRRIYFTSGSADLDDVARETLDIQAAFLQRNPQWLVKLQGYADDPGNNVALSTKRAEAALNYLASKGVDRNRMWAKGYGQERPVRDCADISCKAQNRRVVVNLRTEYDDAAPQRKGGA